MNKDKKDVYCKSLKAKLLFHEHSSLKVWLQMSIFMRSSFDLSTRPNIHTAFKNNRNKFHNFVSLQAKSGKKAMDLKQQVKNNLPSKT